MKTALRIWLLAVLLSFGLASQAQRHSNDFENRYTWYPPWTGIAITTDSTAVQGQYVCLCDTLQEYGLGFEYKVHDTLRGRNLHLRFEADYRFPDTLATGDLVLNIRQGAETPFWTSYPLSQYANDSAQWFHVVIETNLPQDYLEGSTVKCFLWNTGHSRIHIDNAALSITPWVMPNYLPDLGEIREDSITDSHFVLRQKDNDSLLTYPIGMAVEYILEGDTLSEFNLFHRHGERYVCLSGIDSTTIAIPDNDLFIETQFTRDCQLLRQALVIPFIDSTLTVYRSNMHTDTADFQACYYLDREGFKVGQGERSVISYHQQHLSSTQFDAAHRTAWFNLDYWRDHPMIHYPMSDSLENQFDDLSYRPIHKGKSWTHILSLSIGNDLHDLPRIMSIPEGYESGLIFTEHADWTDLRTHRAVYFGSERITKAKDATGGFVHYDIPLTKSVFYNNPDGITNDAISHGSFTGLHATVRGDKDFQRFLKQLDKLGHEICLHTPEQYSTTPGNLKEALSYMRRHFQSASWIDHGYNNGSIHNREDLVCDALDDHSEFYAAKLWEANGIRYLWNAYYEENNLEQWHFDNNLLQPYPGFGDALPNRQITTIVGHDYVPDSNGGSHIDLFPAFLTWSTPSTLDISSDGNWDYYYSEERLQRIVDNHSVHITHVYPAWVMPGRTFWTYDEDSTIVVRPTMNEALKRIASLREEHKMLPMTVKTYLDHYSKLNQVHYSIVDDEHILLQNNGKTIEGFTLLCPSPIRFEDNRYYEYRKTDEGYYVWFDLKAHESLNLKIISQQP